jgi:uridine kinase
MINKEFELKNNTIEAKKGITFYNLILDKDKVKEVAICKLNRKYYFSTQTPY